MADEGDTTLVFEELAYEDVLPVAWTPFAGPVDDHEARRYDDSNHRLLLACAALDEQPVLPRDKPDDGSPVMAELARLDSRLTLVLDLLIHLASRDQRRPDPVRVRFNSIGAAVALDSFLFEMGGYGRLDIFLRSALPQPLTLVARVVGLEKTQAKLRFLPVAAPVGDLIDKFAFRTHRRHVAVSRRVR